MSTRSIKDPIKIIRIIDRLNVGGPAIHTILLTQHMNGQGPDETAWNTLLVYGQEGPSEGNMLELAEKAGVIPTYISSLGRELNPFRDLVSLWKLFNLIRRERPSVVHTHKSKAGVIGRLAARFCNVPVIVHTYHGHVLQGYFSKLKTRFFTAIERRMAGRTDRLIAVSPKVKEDLTRYGIAGADQITVMYLGLDLNKFAQTKRNRGTLRQELQLPPETPLIGIVARLVPIKGIDLFLKAARRLLDRTPEAHFVVVGDGELRKELEQLSERLALSQRTHFLGFRKDVENIYPDLDVLMLTSANEGSPVSLIEGLAAGCAVVSTDVGGVSDVLQSEVSGLLVPFKGKTSDSVAVQLADQTFELLKDPERRRRLGEQGQKDVLNRFNILRLVADLSTLYLHALSQKVL